MREKRKYKEYFKGFGLGIKIIKRVLQKRRAYGNIEVSGDYVVDKENKFVVCPSQELPDGIGEYNDFPKKGSISVKLLKSVLEFFEEHDSIQVFTPKKVNPLILKNDELLVSIAPLETVTDHLDLEYCPVCGTMDDVVKHDHGWYKCESCNETFEKKEVEEK